MSKVSRMEGERHENSFKETECPPSGHTFESDLDSESSTKIREVFRHEDTKAGGSFEDPVD